MSKQEYILKNQLVYKLLFFCVTLALNFFLIYTFKSLHNSPLLIITTLISCFLIGIFLKFRQTKPNVIVKNLAWGLIYGSLTVFVLTLALLIWVSYLYNH